MARLHVKNAQDRVVTSLTYNTGTRSQLFTDEASYAQYYVKPKRKALLSQEDAFRAYKEQVRLSNKQLHKRRGSKSKSTRRRNSLRFHRFFCKQNAQAQQRNAENQRDLRMFYCETPLAYVRKYRKAELERERDRRSWGAWKARFANFLSYNYSPEQLTSIAAAINESQPYCNPGFADIRAYDDEACALYFISDDSFECRIAANPLWSEKMVMAKRK